MNDQEVGDGQGLTGSKDETTSVQRRLFLLCMSNVKVNEDLDESLINGSHPLPSNDKA